MAFNIYLGIFIIVGIVVTAAGCYLLYSLDSSTFGIIGAVIFFIGALVLFCMYGVRWFDPSKSHGLFSDTPDDWAASINTCPDYLTYVDGKGCVDMIGITDQSVLQKYTKERCGNQPSGDTTCYFSVTTTSDQDKKLTLCQNANRLNLTWEGITNGESCTYPTGGTNNGTNSGGNNCPQ